VFDGKTQSAALYQQLLIFIDIAEVDLSSEGTAQGLTTELSVK